MTCYLKYARVENQQSGAQLCQVCFEGQDSSMDILQYSCIIVIAFK